MLHREAEFKPIQQGSSSLRSDILGKPPAGTGATSMFSGRPTGNVPQAPVAAKIEFSGSGMMKSQSPTVSRTEADIPRVVHYSEMKTPVSPFGAAEAGAVRMPQAPPPPQIPRSEILATKPAMPPLPTAPPSPKPMPAVVPQQPMPPAPPRPPVNKEVNYTQSATTPPAPPKPISQAPSPGMTDLKKIASAAPSSPPQIPQGGILEGKPPQPAGPPPTPPTQTP